MIRILREGSIGAGMRRVEALVGPDALREINAERELLRGLVEALGSQDPRAAVEHARRVVEENKRLKNELGQARGRATATAVERVAGTGDRGRRASRSSSRRTTGEDAGELRELAQKVRDRLEGSGGRRSCWAAATAARRSWSAACTPAAVARGVTAPALLATAAQAIGGGAGGKDILAMAGGKSADAVGGGARRRSPRGSRSSLAGV